MDGRGVGTRADGVCHVVPLGLWAGSPSASMHPALQDKGMTGSGRRVTWMAEAFLPWPMVCAM